MAVRIRLKKLGRRHRPYFRICVMDARSPRDGKAIEEVGTYDPMIRDTDKRCTMKADRIDYWLGVGALPTERVARLLEKYKGKVPDIRVDAPREAHIPVARPILAQARKAPVVEETPAEGAPAEGAPAEASAGVEAAVATEEAPAEPQTGEA